SLLRLGRRGHGIGRGGKRYLKRIANHLDDPAAVARRGGAQDSVMPGEGRRPGAGVALGKRGAALDVGEEESHGAGWQVRQMHPVVSDPNTRRPVAWGFFFEGRVYFGAG